MCCTRLYRLLVVLLSAGVFLTTGAQFCWAQKEHLAPAAPHGGGSSAAHSVAPSRTPPSSAAHGPSGGTHPSFHSSTPHGFSGNTPSLFNSGTHPTATAPRMQGSPHPIYPSGPAPNYSSSPRPVYYNAPRPNSYVAPTPVYAQPATNVAPPAHTMSVPQANVVPPANVAPQMNVAPPANSAPPTNVASQASPTPPANVIPPANVAPPANVVPPQDMASATPAPPGGTAAGTPATAQPPANDPFGDSLITLTSQDIQQMARQLRDNQLARLDALSQAVNSGVDDLINQLPDADQLTADQRQQIRDAIANGDPDALRNLLSADDLNSPAGQALLNRAVAQQVINRVRDAINAGNLTPQDIADLVAALQAAFAPGAQDGPLGDAGQIAVDQQVGGWVSAAGDGGGDGGQVAGDPGAAGNDPGADPGAQDPGQGAPMALIPGLPAGTIVPVGSGATLVGMGQPGDQIDLGQGDPAAAAGLDVAPPEAPPAADSSGPPATGDIILGNSATGPVSYTINQNPFTMQPNDEQTLPAGTSWVIDFDRGNGKGTAEYQLSAGYYEFRATDGGWDLYNKDFHPTLENLGRAPFSFLLDNQVQTIGPGESRELSGIYPPVVRFENGAGQYVQRRLDGTTYQVTLNQDRTLDVYPADTLSAARGARGPGQRVPLVGADQTAAASRAAPAPPPAPPAAPIPRTKTAAAGAKAQTAGGVPQAPRATKKAHMNLPPDFTLFDPVAALTKPDAARHLPPAFSLFRSAAEATAKRQTPSAPRG